MNEEALFRKIAAEAAGHSHAWRLPKGAQMEDSIQLFAAPNHRHAGTAYLIVELLDAAFQ